jgi:hypothetical protein
MHGSNTKNLSVKPSVFRTSKNAMFSYYLLWFFSSTKSENRRAEQVPHGGGGGW